MISPPLIKAIVEQHIEELDFLIEQRDNEQGDEAFRHEIRAKIRSHLDGLYVADEAIRLKAIAEYVSINPDSSVSEFIRAD